MFNWLRRRVPQGRLLLPHERPRHLYEPLIPPPSRRHPAAIPYQDGAGVYYRCLRCECQVMVYDGVARCECDEGPCPWEPIVDDRDDIIQSLVRQVNDLSGMLDRLIEVEAAAANLMRVLATAYDGQETPLFALNVEDAVMADALRHAVIALQDRLGGQAPAPFYTDIPERMMN